MDGDRGYSTLSHPDQWARCHHSGTTLLPDGGVALTWTDAPSPRSDTQPAGLAFDRWCRAYRSRPSDGFLEMHSPTGESASTMHGLRRPVGLAVDRAQRLYVAESCAGVVHVVDLWARRLLRRVPVTSGRHPDRRPVDVHARCCAAIVLVERPAGLLVLEGRRDARPGPALRPPRCRGELRPARVTADPEGLLVLWRRPDGPPAVLARADGRVLLEVDDATDVAVLPDATLVLAGAPDAPLRRFRRLGTGSLEMPPLAAPGYDGGAVGVDPTGRVAFTTAAGIGWTGGSTACHVPHGSLVTYRLDSGEYRTRWGRVFLDACVPPGTALALRFLTSDEDAVADPLEPGPPARFDGALLRPEATPPLPSRISLDLAAADTPRPVFRRPTGRELPWAQIAVDDGFETYEAPVHAEPGRYLWIQLTLSGTRRSTPRVRSVRVERPGHRLLDHLPRAWSRDDADARFLHGLLAPAEGLLHELDERAAWRMILVDPHATPQEALAWLAGFTGLVLDRRWPEAARRALIAEAYPLFRRRGTAGALLRILGLYLGRPPTLVEQWQLRGLGGTVLGFRPSEDAFAMGGARAEGSLGRFAVGGASPADDLFATSAHRFTVLVPGTLDPEQLDVVRAIIDRHKPAHTLGEVCELGEGMRIGTRLHVALTSFVGAGGDRGPAILGRVSIGSNGVVGVPAVGSRLGDGLAGGQVRVG